MTTCLACGFEQYEPVIFQTHRPEVEAVMPSPSTVPVNAELDVFWACHNCGRKHNRDGSLYVSPEGVDGRHER